MSRRLHLFEGYGVELEYMIVDRETLDVKPVADAILRDDGGAIVSDLAFGPIGWSNELVAHVLELKTEGPAASLRGLAHDFQQNVRDANRRLAAHGAMLMPTAAHPWMDPDRETTLWAHEYNEVYEAYNRVFDCRGHGWSNLQSTHINLPFGNDEEFGRLHAAIRMVLPLIPMLAASSPIIDGRPTGLLDTRLDFYQRNQARVPSIIGAVIPEAIYTEGEYRTEILERTWRDISAFDTDGVLQGEFLNSRGAIARFSRGAIEIRLVDIQECPAADLAVVQFLSAMVEALSTGAMGRLDKLRAFPTEALRSILLDGVRDGEATLIQDTAYLGIMAGASAPMVGSELLRRLSEQLNLADRYPESAPVLEVMFSEGTLARRILGAVGQNPKRETLRAVYGTLCGCLEEGRLFRRE
jgi:hypothetical protein